jgi:predicted DNA-binding antitoxin AbrB/MazE fold protein
LTVQDLARIVTRRASFEVALFWLQASFEKGVLRPLTPLHLRAEEEVTVTVDQAGNGIAHWEDVDCYEACKKEADESITLKQVQKALSKISGSLTADFIAERDER